MNEAGGYPSAILLLSVKMDKNGDTYVCIDLILSNNNHVLIWINESQCEHDQHRTNSGELFAQSGKPQCHYPQV